MSTGEYIIAVGMGKIPYSRKYWRELNLAVWSQTDITKILADFNLVVQYGIAIRTYVPKKFWRIYFGSCEVGPPNSQI